MKKLGLILTIALVLVGALVISDNASGPSNPAKIAYLDLQKVLQSTKEWQDLNKNYQEDFAFYQKQLDNLTKEYQDMVKSGASSQELATKQQEILTKKAQYEQTLQQTYNSKTQVILDQIKRELRITRHSSIMIWYFPMTRWFTAKGHMILPIWSLNT